MIDVDALPTPVITPKKPRVSRSANSEVSQSSSTKGAEQPSSTIAPLPRKVKAKNAKHWAAGLSKSDIRNLGKRDQSPPPTQQLPRTPPPHSKPSSSAVSRIRSGVEPDTSPGLTVPPPMKRPALPTRINHHQAVRKDVERRPSIVTVMEKQKAQPPSFLIATCSEQSGQSFEENRLLSTDGNHELRQPTSLEHAEDIVVSLKKSTLGEVDGRPKIGDGSTFLPDRLPSEDYVLGCDADADIGSITILDVESEENEGGRHGWLASSEQDQTLEAEQAIRESSILSDCPEYEMAKEFIQR